jgi:hypothetical protein
MSIVLIMINAKANGLNTNQKKIMDFAKFVLSKKMRKRKITRKIQTIKSCLTAMDLANRKV